MYPIGNTHKGLSSLSDGFAGWDAKCAGAFKAKEHREREHNDRKVSTILGSMMEHRYTAKKPA